MVLEELNKLPAIAAHIFLQMKGVDDPKESNCKVLAQRILHFKLAELVPRVQQALAEFHHFLHVSFKGVYCSLCDARTHSLIDVDKKEITLSENFCRQIVSHSLHPLMYFHIHFKKMMNLATSFVTYCDDKGEFNPEEAVPPAALMEIEEADKKLLTECRNFRNDAGWLQYCGGICEKFKFTQFEDFFQPGIKKYHKAVLFLQEKLVKFPAPDPNVEEEEKEAEDEAEEPEDEKKEEEQNAEQQPAEQAPAPAEQAPAPAPAQQAPAPAPAQQAPAPAPAPQEQSAAARKLKRLRQRKYARYLSEEEGKTEEGSEEKPVESEGGEEGGEGEEGEEEEPTLMDLEKKYEKMDLLHKAMNAVVPLDKATCIFGDPGIELFEHGKNAHITEENYLLAKGMGLVENQKIKKVEAPVQEENQRIIQNFISAILCLLVFFKLN